MAVMGAVSCSLINHPCSFRKSPTPPTAATLQADRGQSGCTAYNPDRITAMFFVLAPLHAWLVVHLLDQQCESQTLLTTSE